MKWLLDTNVISETVRARPNESVRLWTDSRAPDRFGISVVTIAKLRDGITLGPPIEAKTSLRYWLDDKIRPIFAERILALDEPVLTEWLRLARLLRARGRPQRAPDLMIAATARMHDLILVSRNLKDFAGTGVLLFDPWNGQHHQMDEP